MVLEGDLEVTAAIHDRFVVQFKRNYGAAAALSDTGRWLKDLQ